MKQQQFYTSEIAGQFRLSLWNTQVNSKGGLENVTELHKFSALVAYSCAEAAVILGTKSMPAVFRTPYLNTAACISY